jgi:high-affinity iron transporter
LDFGALMSALLIGLRLGLESALIVAIILAYLVRTGNARHFDKIWLGTALAVGLSLSIGSLLWATIGDLTGREEDLFEAIGMVAAAAIVTWMIFWMRRTAARVNGGGEARFESKFVHVSVFGMAVLAFTSIIREGIEAVLFVLIHATAARENPSELGALTGGLAGIGIAIGVGFAVYRVASVVRLHTFFRWTGVALVVIGAGLLSHAVEEFVEAGWITVGTATAYDISGVLPHRVADATGPAGVLGSILRAFFDYSSSPAWITLLTWLAYLGLVLTLYIRPGKPEDTEDGRSRPPAGYIVDPPPQDLASAT